MAIYSPDELKPLLIITQILTNQCWFYAIWMNIHLLSCFVLKMDTNLSLSFFFTDYEFSLVDFHFYLIVVELALTCCIMVPIIVYIAERAKKCLDFCSTVFILHLVVCFVVNGLPRRAYWWITMFVCMVAMTLLSERVAVKR